MQSVVITGVSTGIGWATAKLLLDRGFRVFGSVRKAADTDRLGREIGANFTPLLFDVTEEAAVLGGETLCGLVNNAGIAVAGPVLELSVDEFRRQVDRSVARVRSVAEGKAGADRDDQLGGRQEWHPAVVGLFSLEAPNSGPACRAGLARAVKSRTRVEGYCGAG
jgi:NAD(P)-dependent dehydrogenase (short-subunit alcohol dehydrogenase family)